MPWTITATVTATWTKEEDESPLWSSQFLLLSDGTYLLQSSLEEGIILAEEFEVDSVTNVWTKELPL